MAVSSICNDNRYHAVIWDCDGVLIDSEVLACAASVKALGEAGYATTLDDYLSRFMGKGLAQILGEIDAESGRNLSRDFQTERLKQLIAEAFEDGLQATPGMNDLLGNLTLPVAVASGSEVKRLHHSLGLAGLLARFKGHIYSAEMVARGKPAPDVFLLAAEKLGVAPEKCLVIEDGIHGIHGAKAAGMDVIFYTGGSHMRPHLMAAIHDDAVIGRAANTDELQRQFKKLRVI